MELPADCDAEAEGLLRPVLAARMAAASRYKGTVNQVMGDGIMALVDDPIAARGPRRARVLRGAQDAGTCEEICWGKCVGRDVAVIKIPVGLSSGEVVLRAIGSDLQQAR